MEAAPSTTFFLPRSLAKQQAASMQEIWYRDPWQLLARDRIGVFVPLPEMPLEEQLNAVMRFALYFTGAMAALRRDAGILMFAVLAALFTYCIFEADKRVSASKDALLERLNVEDTGQPHNPRCYAPTRANPFMNVMPGDMATFPNRPQACDITDAGVATRVNNYFDAGLHRANGDIYRRTASDRQFYTMPVTTMPNDRDAYARWLYPLPAKSQKEQGGHRLA